MYTNVLIHICRYIDTHIYIYTNIYMYACISIHAYVYINVCKYVYICHIHSCLANTHYSNSIYLYICVYDSGKTPKDPELKSVWI